MLEEDNNTTCTVEKSEEDKRIVSEPKRIRTKKKHKVIVGHFPAGSKMEY